MILLDTNIVSEVMKTRPADAVVAWRSGRLLQLLSEGAFSLVFKALRAR